MGYYTNYSLSIVSDNIKPDLLLIDQINDEVKKLNVFSDGDPYYGWSAYMKWYDFDQDMLLLSKKFPDVLFCLHGEGDNEEDLWDAYYQNGKVQNCYAEIIYPPYDENKMVAVPVTQTRYSYQIDDEEVKDISCKQ